jgi:hypothetical protein
MDITMKIREAATYWLPQVASRSGNFALAEPSDAVLKADRHEAAKSHIRLKLRKEDGTEYTAVLVVTEHLNQAAHKAIAQAKDITLSELGELDI